jgi:membrane fusion protein, multidrug efflux system
MSKQKKFRLGAVLGVLLIALVTIAVLSSRGQSGSSAPAVAPVAVEVTPVAPATITERVSAVGRVSAASDVRISSETAGRVARVLISVGDRVRAGQPLVIVDDEFKILAVDQAKAQRLAAETQFRKAQGDAERSEHLHASGDVSNTELEAYRLALRSAEAAFTSADVALRFAQRQLNDTRIKSPIAGFVVSRSVEVGEMVAPGTEIANVVDLSRIKVRISVAEEDITRLHAGQPATLRVDAQPDRRFEGKVLTIGRKSESPNGHSYPVEVVVENRDTDLFKVGMFARVEVRSKTVTGVPAIAKESLVGEESAPGVFVAENGVARFRPVRLGLRDNDAVQVLEGLRNGELVISFGQKSLADGSPVRYTR